MIDRLRSAGGNFPALHVVFWGHRGGGMPAVTVRGRPLELGNIGNPTEEGGPDVRLTVLPYRSFQNGTSVIFESFGKIFGKNFSFADPLRRNNKVPRCIRGTQTRFRLINNDYDVIIAQV